MKPKDVLGIVSVIPILVLASFLLISCSKKESPIEEVSGTKILKGTRSWDIDSVIDGAKESTDIWWEHVNNNERYLVPQNGALLGLIKDNTFDLLKLGDLQKATLKDSKISASDAKPDIDSGTVLAVRTNEGHLVKLEVTGFDPLKNSSHEIAKYHIKMRYVLYKVSANQDSLEIISITPQSPAILSLGEMLFVKIRYRLTSVDRARIWARPYTEGRRTRGYSAHPSPMYENETGEIEGWFYFENPTKVDEIRVKMVPAGDKQPIAETAMMVSAEWK